MIIEKFKIKACAIYTPVENTSPDNGKKTGTFAYYVQGLLAENPHLEDEIQWCSHFVTGDKYVSFRSFVPPLITCVQSDHYDIIDRRRSLFLTRNLTADHLFRGATVHLDLRANGEYLNVHGVLVRHYSDLIDPLGVF